MATAVQRAALFDPANLGELQTCTQVAAICYRKHKEKLEFLLVHTRGGRWTFPKGGTEPGLTHAQAAALEAFEEAGVHGRIEAASFASYVRGKSERGKSGRNETPVAAFLCEVLRMEPPQEDHRHPTWFCAATAKRRLQQDRRPADGRELARIVDRAVKRIKNQRIMSPKSETQSKSTPHMDPLKKVQFEALESGGIHPAIARSTLARSTRVEVTLNTARADILPFKRH